MRVPKSVKSLEEFGRIRLSKSFFMREFLYSEIAQIERIPNIPENPAHVVDVGRRLCQEVLEPIQDGLGRIGIRSAYRCPSVNAKGAENNQEVLEPIQDGLGRIGIRSAYRCPSVNAKGAENNNQYNCAGNEKNYGRHIWDFPGVDGAKAKGATACIVVPSFLEYYERTNHWQALAWWVHDNIPAYSSMYFFPKLAAFNITWSEKPEKRIDSHITPRGCLTKPGSANSKGSHETEYRKFLSDIET